MNAQIKQAAYLHALNVANNSGHVPGLDQWWAVLKAEEAAELARLVKAEKEERARIEAEEAADLARYAAEDARWFGGSVQIWRAWTYGEAGMDSDKWTRAHLIVNGAPACGRGPSGEARWGHEDDADTGRCRACERRA